MQQRELGGGHPDRRRILSIDRGSATLKTSVYELGASREQRLLEGGIERLGAAGVEYPTRLPQSARSRRRCPTSRKSFASTRRSTGACPWSRSVCRCRANCGRRLLFGKIGVFSGREPARKSRENEKARETGFLARSRWTTPSRGSTSSIRRIRASLEPEGDGCPASLGIPAMLSHVGQNPTRS